MTFDQISANFKRHPDSMLERDLNMELVKPSTELEELVMDSSEQWGPAGGRRSDEGIHTRTDTVPSDSVEGELNELYMREENKTKTCDAAC